MGTAHVERPPSFPKENPVGLFPPQEGALPFSLGGGTAVGGSELGGTGAAAILPRSPAAWGTAVTQGFERGALSSSLQRPVLDAGGLLRAGCRSPFPRALRGWQGVSWGGKLVTQAPAHLVDSRMCPIPRGVPVPLWRPQETDIIHQPRERRS